MGIFKNIFKNFSKPKENNIESSNISKTKSDVNNQNIPLGKMPYPFTVFQKKIISFNYDFSLENYTPDIKLKNYSIDVSLLFYLNSLKLSNKEIKELMESQNIIEKRKEMLSDNDNIFEINSKCIYDSLVFKTILNDFNDFYHLLALLLIEETFFYSGIEDLMKLPHNEYYIKQYKEFLSDRHKKNHYIHFFDKKIYTCIAVFQKRYDVTLTDLVKNIMKEIENCYNDYETAKIIFKYIPNKYLQNSIIKSFTDFYKTHNITLAGFFIDDSKMDFSNLNNKLFDIDSLKKAGKNRYYISQNYWEKCTADIESLNRFIDVASNIIHKQLTNIIVSDIHYSESNDYHDITTLEFTPFTKTGKAYKYPYTLYFSTLSYMSDGVVGRLYYLNDGNIGKAELTTWKNFSAYTINVAIKKGELIVTKITNLRGDNKVVIYNYNKK